ncbi:hypothetical protein B0J17DRAFT_743449 [Rhizoctonia solani]|nr:hypothetical protein B0J17DRAFT_743449 [Rhizoctonia solani]
MMVYQDLVGLQSYYDAYADRKKGNKKPAMSWIWRTRAAPNTEDQDVEGLKTEWFRARERYKRWEEQLVLTKREMGKFYSELANQMLVSCHKELYDDTVELRWCSGWLRENALDRPLKLAACNGLIAQAMVFESWRPAWRTSYLGGEGISGSQKTIDVAEAAGLTQSGTSSKILLGNTREESNQLPTSSGVTFSKSKRNPMKSKSPRSESTHTSTAFSPTLTLDSTDDDNEKSDQPEATVGEDRDEEVDEIESTRDKTHEASSSITDSTSHVHETQAPSGWSSPTFPLTRLRRTSSISPSYASSVGKRTVVNGIKYQESNNGKLSLGYQMLYRSRVEGTLQLHERGFIIWAMTQRGIISLFTAVILHRRKPH